MQNLENTTCKKIALATAMIGMGLVGTPDVKADEIKQHVLTTARTERPISRKATVQPKSTRLPSAIQVKTKNIPDLKQQPVVNAVQTKTGGQQASGTKTSASKVAHTGTDSKRFGHGNKKRIQVKFRRPKIAVRKKWLNKMNNCKATRLISNVSKRNYCHKHLEQKERRCLRENKLVTKRNLLDKRGNCNVKSLISNGQKLRHCRRHLQ